MAGLLDSAVSGLVTFQRNLATTGHNIANVNTDGFSRQRVEMSTRTPQLSGNGFIGTGVKADAVIRVYDQLLFDQKTNASSRFHELDTLQNMASRIDDMFANDQAGLDPMLQAFFDSVNGVANDPTAIPSRQVLLSDAESLTNRFNTISNQLDVLDSTVNSQLEGLASEVSAIARSIANFNADIALQQGLAGGGTPNDLLDQRDIQLSRLSEIVAISTVEQSDGAVNVFVGSGQTLVLGNVPSEFAILRNDYDQSQFEIALKTTSSTYTISDQLSGGQIGGLLEFRDEVLNPAKNDLGRIAIVLADTINTQHKLGDDLAGAQGLDLFNTIITTSPEVLANSNNGGTGVITTAVTDTTVLGSSEYRLLFDGTDYHLTRLSDNTEVTGSPFLVGAFPITFASEGIELTFASGAINAGDDFLIRPTRQGAADIAVALTDPAKIAAAADTAALGDNTNALAMAAMQTQKLLGNGTETYQAAFGKAVASVGVKTGEAQSNATAQEALLRRANDRVASISGVNLDEEAANLLKFQQAYQAAARVFSVANDVFQTLINATGR